MNIDDERNRSDEVDRSSNAETRVKTPNAELHSQLHPGQHHHKENTRVPSSGIVNRNTFPMLIGEGFNNPSHGKFPLGGYPPSPGPSRTRFSRKVNGNFLTYLNGQSVAENGIFSQKMASLP